MLIASFEPASRLAWSCLFDTHNDVRLAVDALSGGLLDTIYAKTRRSVRGASGIFQNALSVAASACSCQTAHGQL